MSRDQLYTIGHVSRLCRLSVQTLRYVSLTAGSLRIVSECRLLRLKRRYWRRGNGTGWKGLRQEGTRKEGTCKEGPL